MSVPGLHPGLGFRPSRARRRGDRAVTRTPVTKTVVKLFMAAVAGESSRGFMLRTRPAGFFGKRGRTSSWSSHSIRRADR